MSGCGPFDSDLEWIVTVCVLILLSVCDVLMRESVVCEFSGFFFAGLRDWNPLCVRARFWILSVCCAGYNL